MKDLPDEFPEPLAVAAVDAHCHLDIVAEYSGQTVPQLIQSARHVGITRIVQTATDVASSQWAVAAAEIYPELIATVTLHPNEAAVLGEAGELTQALNTIQQLVQQDNEKLRGIGETGLDYFRTTSAAGKKFQAESFAQHIRWSHEFDKTLVIHDRDAHSDIVAMLDSEGVPQRFVMHCFSGDQEFAEECTSRGGFLSFGGTVTFKGNDHLREALLNCPRDKILTETDAPFLAPVPYRGHTNSPALLPTTIRAMGELLGLSADEVAELSTQNAVNAFGGSW